MSKPPTIPGGKICWQMVSDNWYFAKNNQGEVLAAIIKTKQGTWNAYDAFNNLISNHKNHASAKQAIRRLYKGRSPR